MLNDLTSILLVKYCLGCGRILQKQEQVLCLGCRERLCETGFEQVPHNPLEQLLLHRCEVKAATSLFFFEKNKLAQLLIHKLKYEGQEQVGRWLGLWLGRRLAQSRQFEGVEMVVPVPLHPKKLHKRGYNQVTKLGKAIAETMGVVFDDSLLVKKTASATQTRKFVWKRYDENDHIFAIQNPQKLATKHILLVDDVITTGSTIERCYQALMDAEDVKVSVASIACAIIS